MPKTSYSLVALIDEVEREIVTRKRLYAGRAKAGDEAAGDMIGSMKSIADILRRLKEAQETGRKIMTEWHPLDPGRPLPDYVEGPRLLSALVRVPAGGHRTETIYLAPGQRGLPIAPIYAWSDLPLPAVFTEENMPCTPASND